MDTTLNVANAWQRLLRQSLLTTSTRVAAAANDDSVFEAGPVDGGSPFDAAETLPMLYRSEAFAEDLSDSHPQPA